MVDAVVVISTLGAAWLWLGGSMLVSFVALEKNRNAFGWFFVGLILSPLLSLIALAAMPDKPVDKLTEQRTEAPMGEDERWPRRL